MSFLPKPPLINESKNFNEISVSNTAKFTRNNVGFFGNLSNQKEDDGSLESVLRILRAYGLSSTITPIEQTDGPFAGNGTYPPSGGADVAKSVCINKNGDTIAISWQKYEVNSDIVGCVFIYVKIGNSWTQQGELLYGTGNVDSSRQGSSVSLSSDGNTLAVGGISDNGNTGATWIFTRSEGVWTQQGTKLTGDDVSGAAEQGSSVSLSSDGNTLVVGGPADDGDIGATWVYVRSNGIWTQQGQKLLGNDVVGNAKQGFSVSLSSDGNTLTTSGKFDNNNVGATWVYTRSNGVWSQQGPKLVGNDGFNFTLHGDSLSLSSDGNILAVGSINDNNEVGATWIFTRSDGVWEQHGPKLVGTGYVGKSRQGSSVSLSSDGNILIVGGKNDVGYTSIEDYTNGVVWYFLKINSQWIQQGTKIVPDNADKAAVSMNFGNSLSLADTNEFVVGAHRYNNNGAAWTFKIK